MLSLKYYYDNKNKFNARISELLTPGPQMSLITPRKYWAAGRGRTGDHGLSGVRSRFLRTSRIVDESFMGHV